MNLPARLILTDVDEVVLHWTDAFTDWLKTYKNIFPTKYRNDHYISKWLEIHPDDACELVVEFNSSKHFGVLEPYDCASIYLPKLHAEGFKIVAITSCSSHNFVADMRKMNLRKYFGDIFETVHCLDFTGDKGEVLATYPKAFWVEDSDHWAVVGADIGHTTFLVDHLHNKHLNDKRITRVSNWYEIYTKINAILG
jgi:5'(3')-deoxyribonucleotidase